MRPCSKCSPLYTPFIIGEQAHRMAAAIASDEGPGRVLLPRGARGWRTGASTDDEAAVDKDSWMIIVRQGTVVCYARLYSRMGKACKLLNRCPALMQQLMK